MCYRKEDLMYEKSLSKRGLCLFFILVITIFVSIGCALSHKIYYGNLRKGYIDEVADSAVIVLLGLKTGAEVGKELDVYEITISSGLKAQPRLNKWELKGRIRIAKIIDDYHSAAIIVSGQVKENYKCVPCESVNR